ncbi:NADPH-dependent FMN reductase-domain-containing protein [Coniochaeta sp. 2T2.1]|nr:NADPH-dependent FMN reductase-domain-containing protein [Coniochaeta sp. 2T2.1]
MSEASPKHFKVGIITASQRQPRCGDQIATFVLSTLTSHLTTHPPASTHSISFQPLDLLLLSLPLSSCEPGIPSQIHSPSDYTHPHTQTWSRTISALDGFVFVTPQYNWGIPAGLKNAIDYLYHEWKGKPAMIVSYGGHGGGKCAEALKVVLGGGVGMRVVEETVGLAFPDRGVLGKAAGGGDLGLDMGEESMWAGERGRIVRVWKEMEGMLGA